MKKSDERTYYVLQHKEGYFIDIAGNMSTDFMRVTRWHNIEEINDYLYRSKHYAPTDPENYIPRKVKATYELEDDTDGFEGDNEVPTGSISTG
ncbi:hypothetical protein G9G63_10145 [Paenibacillus sp. EKM202P]|uniref:hypothetical protein n=1 Tax=unclassified Paenibacillus TaxID=185978 RepID=UPI0013ED4B38|nr:MULTISPECIES: hypothetical protein [unclassified Paenibacillus]KAF6564495.1 hypothetical protein G9G63_10145 [Paenibacillus sp. EKM202P]KAF6571690.1 hypothetical protein G9G64_06630 [Paenibacillus sp. EKM207P]